MPDNTRSLPKRLGEIMMDRGMITYAQLISALDEQEKTRDFLGQILLRRSQISREQLDEALTEKFETPYSSLKMSRVDWHTLEKINPTLVVEDKCIPVAQNEEFLTAAAVNPLDERLKLEVRRAAGARRVRWIVLSAQEMQAAFHEYKRHLQGGRRS